MKLSAIIAGYKIGEPCMGAVMLYGLQAVRLAERGMLKEINGVWCRWDGRKEARK